ncbi:MAG: tetratricopeptide repeat protein [Verrucomicrobiota bacterium]
MPRLLPLLAFLGWALHAAAAPDPAPKEGEPPVSQAGVTAPAAPAVSAPAPAPAPSVAPPTEVPPPPSLPPAVAAPAPPVTVPPTPPAAAPVSAPVPSPAPSPPDSSTPAAIEAPPAGPAAAATPPAPPPAPGGAEAPPAAKPVPVFSAVQKFDHAITAYNAGSYDEARRDFLELVADGHLSASLAHNLANIEYKSGNDGLAALWYRRALAIQPFSVETLQNLRFLRHRTGFQTWDTYGISISHFSAASAMNATLLIAWAALILLVWLIWSPPRPGRRWPLVTLLLLLLPAGAAGGALWWLAGRDQHPLAKRYVLTGATSAAYAAPAEASSQLISLPTGSEVMPLEIRGNWFYCEIPTESAPVLRGWVRSSLLEPLWPYPASPRG